MNAITVVVFAVPLLFLVLLLMCLHIIVGVRRSCVTQKNPISCCEATIYTSSEHLSRNEYFVSDTLSTCYNLFHLSGVPVSFRYIDITITAHIFQ